MRPDGRNNDELRQITFERNFTDQTAGSVLVSFGRTKVLCTVSIDDDVPRWMRGKGEGWVTAEYSMLPYSTLDRKRRDSSKGKIDGRSQEIQRLIGRSMRAALDLTKLGQRTVWIDCDVLQADGGTRTASITGAYVALSLALSKLKAEGLMKIDPIISPVAAVSVGVVDNVPVLDLPYVEDVAAEVDMNLVMNAEGEFIELQGTGEKDTFNDAELSVMLKHGRKGIGELLGLQKTAIAAG